MDHQRISRDSFSKDRRNTAHSSGITSVWAFAKGHLVHQAWHKHWSSQSNSFKQLRFICNYISYIVFFYSRTFIVSFHHISYHFQKSIWHWWILVSILLLRVKGHIALALKNAYHSSGHYTLLSLSVRIAALTLLSLFSLLLENKKQNLKTDFAQTEKLNSVISIPKYSKSPKRLFPSFCSLAVICH